MNNDEKRVQEYLISKGFNNIIFEPDGNVPPDFVVNTNIAIEARRLNPIFNNGNINEPLDYLSHKLVTKIKGIFNGYSDPSI